MAQSSHIEWTDATWNPVTGCTKISPGCAHCYAATMAKRLEAMGQARYRNGFKVTLQPDVLEAPLRWKQPKLVFVNSMSDLFHDAVPGEYIASCFDVMNRAKQHTFQVLTKRPLRAEQLASGLTWTPNIWLGVSVENANYVSRINYLTRIPARIRFLSIEPLLGAIPNLPLDDIHWVIVGGESGPGARTMQEVWVVQIRDQCVARGVPFFFKQWGGVQKFRTGRRLQGRFWNQMPTAMEVLDGKISRSLELPLRAA